MTVYSTHNLLARLGTLLMLVAVMLGTAKAKEIPAPVKSDPDLQLRLLGNTEVRWMGMTLYEAALWSENELFDGSNYAGAVMLSITYQKSISNKRLIQATDKQWRRLNVADEIKRQRWLKRLRTIWPDVEPGDVIAAVVMQTGQTRFYNRDTMLGTVNDSEFGPGFLSIWLSPQSELKRARRQLLNIQKI